MDIDIIQEVDRMLARAKLVKQCARCGTAYTDMDNLDLPCMVHPGSWHRDNAQAGHRFWSCCGRMTELVGADIPCTPASHDPVMLGGTVPQLSVIPCWDGSACEDGLRAAHPATDPIIVGSTAQLRACAERFGAAFATHPNYRTVVRYVGLSMGTADAPSRYFVPSLPGGYEPDDTVRLAIAPEPPRQVIRFIVATAHDLSRVPVSVVASNLCKTAKHAPHLVRLFARTSVNPTVRAEAALVIEKNAPMVPSGVATSRRVWGTK